MKHLAPHDPLAARELEKPIAQNDARVVELCSTMR
jgi:hypothetical protein